MWTCFWIPNNHVKRWALQQSHDYNPSAGQYETGNAGDCWPASIVKLMNFIKLVRGTKVESKERKDWRKHIIDLNLPNSCSHKDMIHTRSHPPGFLQTQVPCMWRKRMKCKFQKLFPSMKVSKDWRNNLENWRKICLAIDMTRKMPIIWRKHKKEHKTKQLIKIKIDKWCSWIFFKIWKKRDNKHETCWHH